jgi:hypothetical protein
MCGSKNHRPRSTAARTFDCVVDETTSWKTPFGEQRDARNAHLDALPGKMYRDWFEALDFARVWGQRRRA